VCVGITDQEALTRLEQTPGSFGTAAQGLIVSEGRHVQALAVDGVSPGNRTYPFLLTLVLLHRPAGATPATLEFLDFVRSKEGRRILSKAGYQPLPAPPPGRGK
jgi:phosphate transport system substrate-binding protein